MTQRASRRCHLLPIVLLGGVATVLGCGDDRATTTAVVFDSAGITIAASPADVLSDLRAWRLEQPPLVEIGGGEGARGHRFAHVVGATLLGNGAILVGDAGNGGLRLFDAIGRTLRTFPGPDLEGRVAERHVGEGHLSEREGEGGDPVISLHAIGVLAGDTIVTSTRPFGLVSRFGVDGTFFGSVSFGPFCSKEVVHILLDGSLLFDLFDRGYDADIEAWVASGTESVFRPRGWLVRVFPDGRQHTLREIRGPEWFKTGEIGKALWWGPRPFGPRSAVAVAGSRVYFGDSERAEIEVLSLGGELHGLVRWEEAAVPVTEADRARVRGAALASIREPARRSHLEAWLEEVPYPEVKPAFSALFADRAGGLWIQVPTPAGAPNDRWIVFDVDGHSLASLEPPAGSRLLDAGEDFLLLAWEDSAGRKLVRLYRLEK